MSDLTLPEGVSKIGVGAFQNCFALEHITIPSTVESVEKDAFYNCNGLTEIIILEGVKTIDYRAFRGCDKLKSIIIPSSVVSIGEEAFGDCHELTDISFLGGNVKSIGKYAFTRSLQNERKVNITDLKSWCGIEFGNEYANPLWNASNAYLYVKDVLVKNLDISNGLETIGDYAFANLTLDNITIPSSVTTIGSKAFYWCMAHRITSYIREPFAVDDDVFFSYSSSPLYVPKGTKVKYETTAGWKNFWNIVEMDETSIDTVIHDVDVTVKDQYSLGGQRMSAQKKGLNIIRMSDGSVRKIVLE